MSDLLIGQMIQDGLAAKVGRLTLERDRLRAELDNLRARLGSMSIGQLVQTALVDSAKMRPVVDACLAWSGSTGLDAVIKSRALGCAIDDYVSRCKRDP